MRQLSGAHDRPVIAKFRLEDSSRALTEKRVASPPFDRKMLIKRPVVATASRSPSGDHWRQTIRLSGEFVASIKGGCTSNFIGNK